MTGRFSAAIFALSLLLAAGRPAGADMPSFAGYFSGTWVCSSEAESHIVKAYGSAPTLNALELLNTYVSKAGFAFGITEYYAQHGDTATVLSQLAPGIAFLGTSPGFAGDNLVFTGTVTAPSAVRFQRMTYKRADQNHFTRTIEDAATSAGQMTVVSTENCTRSSTAPVPTPTPH
jgi:hypothetical protein